jgi:hypothetical protein
VSPDQRLAQLGGDIRLSRRSIRRGETGEKGERLLPHRAYVCSGPLQQERRNAALLIEESQQQVLLLDLCIAALRRQLLSRSKRLLCLFSKSMDVDFRTLLEVAR